MPAFGPNHVWPYNFVFDASASGKQIKRQKVIDEFAHKCLAIDIAGSIRSGRVIETLRRHYNHVRPHSSPRDLTPIEFKNTLRCRLLESPSKVLNGPKIRGQVSATRGSPRRKH